MVWNVKVTQGQNLKTCGASLEKYEDTVSLAIYFHWKSCIALSAHQDTIYPKEMGIKMSFCCLLTANKQEEWWTNVIFKYQMSSDKQEKAGSSFTTFHSRHVHSILPQAFVHTSPSGAFSYILITTSTLMLPQYFGPPPATRFLF